MQAQIEWHCPTHANRYQCPDALIDYSPPFDEYGFIIHDGGESQVTMAYCPWCGAKLPASKRQRWFKELEQLGYEKPTLNDVPTKYRTDAWYTLSEDT